jgi:AbrB family looped-hinge helix DNA binding protein
MEVVVTRKGRVTLPVALRRKYGIREGTKLLVEECESGIIFKVIPRLEDLVGVDAGKVGVDEAFKELDKMRAQDRY